MDVAPLGDMDICELILAAQNSKAILICTFVKTKYSTPSHVVPLVMPFPKLSLE